MITVAPRLETQRLTLAAATRNDFETLAAIWALPETVRFIGGVPRERQDAWFAMLRGAGFWQILGYGYWIAKDRMTGAVLGEVGFADFMRGLTPDISGGPEAGWVFAPEVAGRGLATEAVLAIHRWLDTETSHKRATCIIEPAHAASIRVAEKCGYQQIAISTYRGADVLVMARQRAGT